MARGDGLEDLREARHLADLALQALRSKQYDEATATASVATLYLSMAHLAVEVLAHSSVIPQGAPYERAWQGWRSETGSQPR